MFKFNSSFKQVVYVCLIILIGFVVINPIAMAHHPMGGKTPSNFFEGIMSGFGHPILGIDHFTFVIASGLIAVGKLANIFIPISFVIATIIGVVIHLFSVDLPITEVIVASSVIIFGCLVILKNNSSFQNKLNKIFPLIPAIIAGFAGIFHGYAYGEAIIGAESTPLFAYLFGLAIMQLIIAISAFIIGDLINHKIAHQAKLITRFLGITIMAIGGVFLVNSLFA